MLWHSSQLSLPGLMANLSSHPSAQKTWRWSWHMAGCGRSKPKDYVTHDDARAAESFQFCLRLAYCNTNELPVDGQYSRVTEARWC
jgi:hypothetical protein